MAAPNVYAESFLLRTCDCDFQGAWRPSAILTAMQEAAGMHSELLGCGRRALLENSRTVWVLSRCEVHMERYPVIGDRVTVETFPTANRRWFFPRYYRFLNEKGEELGCGVTLWVLLNIDDRKMAPPGEVAALLPANADQPLPMGLPGTVEEADAPLQVYSRQPVYFDVDVNQHVNNTRYADWACDALGMDVMREYFLSTLVIHYDAEVRPDQEMELHLYRAGENWRLAGYHGEKMHFELGGRLMRRTK